MVQVQGLCALPLPSSPQCDKYRKQGANAEDRHGCEYTDEIQPAIPVHAIKHDANADEPADTEISYRGVEKGRAVTDRNQCPGPVGNVVIMPSCTDVGGIGQHSWCMV